MKNCSTYLVIVLPLLFFGCCAGSIISLILGTSPRGWVLLKSPPQKISKLRTADFFTVYAETRDGKIISCRYNSAYNYDCWNEVPEMQDIKEVDKCYDLPSPPPEIHSIDRIDFGACTPFAGMEGYSFSSYVLSDDGQVYRMSAGSPALINLSLSSIRRHILFSFIGSIIGLALALILLVIQKRQSPLTIPSG